MSSELCVRCHTRPVRCYCSACTPGQGAGAYCGLRCQSIDSRHGAHEHGSGRRDARRTLDATLAHLDGVAQDGSVDPVLGAFMHARAVSEAETEERFAQGCSNYPSFGLRQAHLDLSALCLDRPPQAAHLRMHRALVDRVSLLVPMEHAHPAVPLLLVPHLQDSVYLHLGEESYESAHVLSLRPFQRRFPLVKVNPLCEEVGRALGQLHFKHGVDAYNFALTWAENGPHLHLDPLYTNPLQSRSPEAVQCFGAILGMSPYVPRADAGDAFDAFCRGYGEEAKEETSGVVEVMKTFLS